MKNKSCSNEKFSIVIPCYNEIDNLERLTTTIKNNFNNEDIEFILVENGSTDMSRKWFESTSLIDGKLIKACYVDNNIGYGYGIIKGLEQCTGRFVGWIHADFQVSPLEIKKVIQLMEKEVENNNIFIKGKRKNRNISEKLFSVGMSFAMSLILGKAMYDINAVPVVFARELLDEVLCNPPYSLDFDLYMYYFAIKNGYRIKRFDVEYQDRLNGKSSWDAGIKSRIHASVELIKKAIIIRKEIKKS